MPGAKLEKGSVRIGTALAVPEKAEMTRGLKRVHEKRKENRRSLHCAALRSR
jgi:hypothetical protein